MDGDRTSLLASSGDEKRRTCLITLLRSWPTRDQGKLVSLRLSYSGFSEQNRNKEKKLDANSAAAFFVLSGDANGKSGDGSNLDLQKQASSPFSASEFLKESSICGPPQISADRSFLAFC